jgi:uncharacterized protein
MAADTEGLVKYLITSLVEDAEAVSIATHDSDESVTYEVTVASDDVGKVIGRQGRIIKAIRTLVRAAGAASSKQVEVEIAG